jgi:hypothetical protein
MSVSLGLSLYDPLILILLALLAASLIFGLIFFVNRMRKHPPPRESDGQFRR